MKLKKSILSLLVILVYSNLKAQDQALIVTTKSNPDRSVTLTAEKKPEGTYTLVINFKQLTNANSFGNPIFRIRNSNDNFLTLNPSNKDQGIGLSYSYSYIRGELNPKVNTLFVYALPYKAGKKTRPVESKFVNATYFGATTPEDWKVYHFYSDEADTVTAVRKGTVVEIIDLYDDDTKDLRYTSKTNSLIIEHADGTLATYRGFKKGIFVKEGQTVFPGTALGMNSMANDRHGISLMITYLKSADITTARSNIKESKSLYGFVDPYFCTTANANGKLTNQQFYTAVLPAELIQKEMSKKELKALNKK